MSTMTEDWNWSQPVEVVCNVLSVLVAVWAARYATLKVLAHERAVFEHERRRQDADDLERSRSRIRDAYAELHRTVSLADAVVRGVSRTPNPDEHKRLTELHAVAHSQLVLLRFLEDDRAMLDEAGKVVSLMSERINSWHANFSLAGPAESLLMSRLRKWREQDAAGNRP